MTMSYPEVRQALWDEKKPHARPQSFFDACNADVDAKDRVMAALLTRNHLLTGQLLLQLPDPSAHRAFRPYPESAVRLRDKEMVHKILQCLRGLDLPKKGSWKVRNEYFVSGDTGFHIPHAISAALECEDLEIIDILVQFTNAYLPLASHAPSTTWLKVALGSGNLEEIKRAFQLLGREGMQLGYSTIFAAYNPKSAHLIPTLPEEFVYQNLDEGSWMTVALSVAVHSGCAAAVEAVLDKGRVHIDTRFPTPEVYPVSKLLLELAMKRNLPDAVACLLPRGAVSPAFKTWPRHKRAWVVLRDRSVATEGKALPTWESSS